ncbi:TPA: hypothetical protein ACP5TT_002992 [Vibrio parahaemolyticus]
MLNNLLTAYYGEIYGIAFFSNYLNNYKQAEQRALWQTLVDVEKLTAEKLKPVLQAHGMEIEDRHQEMMEKGLSDAEKWIDLPWSELVATLLNWVEPYEVTYREWQTLVIEKNSNAVNFQTAFDLVAEHETAIYQCWQRYHTNESGLPILHAFLAKYR